MIQKNPEKKFKAQWSDCLKTVTAIARSGRESDATVQEPLHSDMKMYSYDDIMGKICTACGYPKFHSLDAIYFKPKSIECIEFKQGFRSKISKYDPAQAICEHTGKECPDQKDFLKKRRKAEIKSNIAELRFKAVESYLIFEHEIFPDSDDADWPMRVNLTVVVDFDPIEEEIDAYSDVRGSQGSQDVRELKKHIQDNMNFYGPHKGTDDREYLYDHVEVRTFNDVQAQLDRKPDRL